MEILNSVNGKIQEATPSAVVEVMRQQVRELPQMILNDRFITNSLRGLDLDLQEKFDAATSQGDAFDVGVNKCSRSDPTPKESQNFAGYFCFKLQL